VIPATKLLLFKFTFSCAEIAVTTADWTPVIGSGIVALIGIILLVMRKGK